MALSILGYVNTPPRVGQSNSPFTSSPACLPNVIPAVELGVLDTFLAEQGSSSVEDTSVPAVNLAHFMSVGQSVSFASQPDVTYILAGVTASTLTLTKNFTGPTGSTTITSFSNYYPQGSEPNPRVDYMVLVMAGGLLVDAAFGWTKNEVVARFDYDATAQRFRTLPGGLPLAVGTLSPAVNVTGARLSVPVPADLGSPPISPPAVGVSAAPWRLFVGQAPGILPGFTTSLVTAFGTPPQGTVEILTLTVGSDPAGSLNWHPSDATDFSGLAVSFQAQAFFTFGASDGSLGLLSSSPQALPLLLTPLPATGQTPLVRIEFSPYIITQGPPMIEAPILWRTPVEKASASAFTLPGALTPGTFEWAADTGQLNFPTEDLASGLEVYYDGVLIGAPPVPNPIPLLPLPSWGASGSQLPVLASGMVPSVWSSTAPDTQFFPNQNIGGDLILQVPITPAPTPTTTPAPVIQFSSVAYVTPPTTTPPSLAGMGFTSGQSGVLQLQQQTFQISPPLDPITYFQFSASDTVTYKDQPFTLYSGDLPLERGISLRLFRTPVNLTGVSTALGGESDVVSVYQVTGATYANPIIGVPQVILPQSPRDDGSLVVSIAQGTGTYPPSVLALLDGTVPLPVGPQTYGYLISYDTRQLTYAVCKNDLVYPLLQEAGTVVLPDALVQTSSLSISLETGVGTGVFGPLNPGIDYLFDGNSTVTFIETQGGLVTTGQGTFSGSPLTIFTDINGSFAGPNADYGAVVTGDTLIILGLPPDTTNVYSVASVESPTQLVTDFAGVDAQGNPLTQKVTYEIHRGSETMADRYFEQVSLLDPGTRIERILPLGVIGNANTILSGTATFPNTTTLSDLLSDFTQVQPGDTIQLTSGTDTTNYRSIQTVSQHTLTVQDAFTDFVNTGTSATLSSVVGSTVTLTGLTDMTPASVGQKITISGSTKAGNNGSFPIASYISASSVTYTNAKAVGIPGTFNVTHGTTLVTSSARSSVFSGQVLSFSSQPGVTYTVSTVVGFLVTLSYPYTGTTDTVATAGPSGISWVTPATLTYNVLRSFNVPRQWAKSSLLRIRFGTQPNSNFSAAVNVVAKDSDFTPAIHLTPNVVEVSAQTGNLNFSAFDITLGLHVFWARTLTVNTDYSISGELGFISFTQRFLAYEEALLTYTSLNTLTGATTPVVEPAVFRIRKELVQPHLNPTSVLNFNPTGRIVVSNPSPAVWRGGRPQLVGGGVLAGIFTLSNGSTAATVDVPVPLSAGQSVTFSAQPGVSYTLNAVSGLSLTLSNAYTGADSTTSTAALGGNAQCVVNTTASTITFLPDLIITTDALPHGATVNTTENIYIDYYITQAIGGEQNVTIQQPPMQVAQVVLTQDSPSFVVEGDQTAVLTPGCLLRVKDIEVHLIDTVGHDPIANQTTVTLVQGDMFSDNYPNNPSLYQTSGPTRISATPYYPSYFGTELTPYQTIPRGMNVFTLTGDLTAAYRAGTVIRFNNLTSSYQNFYSVSAVTLNTLGNTTITLSSNTLQQYTWGTDFLSHTLHPILEDSVTSIATLLNPVAVPTTALPLSVPPLTVIRRTEGTIGKTLTPTTDFTIDASGLVAYKTPLHPNESISVLYTGYIIQPAGLNLQATYVAVTAPTVANGLLNQILQANYVMDLPDTFYLRVETLTNFRGEVAQNIQTAAQASIPSGGPTTSNAVTGPLFTKGQPSLYYNEGYYADEDYVSRITLKFYNDIINDLEDVLAAMDGRVVGDSDGRFNFDGTIGRYVTFSYDAATSTATGQALMPIPAAVLPLTGTPAILNQIDDNIQIVPASYPPGITTSPALPALGTPSTVTYPLYPDYVSYFQPAYATGPYSRFFKNTRNIFTTSPLLVPPEPNTPGSGAIVGQYNFQNLTSLPGNTFKRTPRAQVQFSYPFGSVLFLVDNVLGTNDVLQRPAFVVGMQVVIADALGNYYISEADAATVTSVSSSAIAISVGIHSPKDHTGLLAAPTPAPPATTPTQLPAGATIFVSSTDINVSQWAAQQYDTSATGAYSMSYRFGRDVNNDLSGNIYYQAPYWPFDGNSFFALPTFLIPESSYCIPVADGDILQVLGAGVSVNYVAPYRFPALDGLTYNDDGDQAVPMVGPLFNGEITSAGGGTLNDELSILTSYPFVFNAVLKATAYFEASLVKVGYETPLVATPPTTPVALSGTFSVLSGSTSVTSTVGGVIAAGQLITFNGSATSYTVSAVVGFVFTLSSPYSGTTDPTATGARIVALVVAGDVFPQGGSSFQASLTYTPGPSTANLPTATTFSYDAFAHAGSGQLTSATTLLLSGSWTVILPTQYDLVRIIDVHNGASGWHHIVNVVGNTLTVLEPFVYPDPNTVFNFEVALGCFGPLVGTLLSPAGPATISGVTLTDTSATQFTYGLVGMTVVITTAGAAEYLRRQIVAVPPAGYNPLTGIFTQLTLSSSLPSGSYSYIIVNSLNTYNGPLLAQVETDLITELSSVGTEIAGLQAFINDVFSLPLVTSTSGQLTVQGTLLADTTVNFIDSGVAGGDYVWVQSGDSNGAYQIGSVTGENNLVLNDPVVLRGGSASISNLDPITMIVTITGLSDMQSGMVGNTLTITGTAGGLNDGDFTITAVPSSTSAKYMSAGANAPDVNNGGISWSTPSLTLGLTYSIVSAFGCPDSAIQDVYGILVENSNWKQETTAWHSMLTTHIPIVGDSGSYANGVLSSDISNRISAIGVSYNPNNPNITPSGRLGDLTSVGTGFISILENVLAGSANLYNFRYSWVNGRLNLVSGFLANQATAVTNRLAAQTKLVNQLYMLEAVQNGG